MSSSMSSKTPTSSRPTSAKTRRSLYSSPSKSKEKEAVEIANKLQKALVKTKILEHEIETRKQEKDGLAQARADLKQRIEEYEQSLQKEKEDSFSIASEMTRQYKLMESAFVRRINELEDENLELREQVEMYQIVLEETKLEKETQLKEKDSVIAEQQRKMEHMALEFSDMLKETLEKMGERIEEAAKLTKDAPLTTFVTDPEAGPVSSADAALFQRLQEFNIRLN